LKNDEGAVELGAVLILFFLSALLGGLTLFSSAAMKYFQNNRAVQDERDAAYGLVTDVVEAVQILKNEENDYNGMWAVQKIESVYAGNNLSLTDISSGYHLDFLSEKDLNDANLASFLFLDKSPHQYIRIRDERGLSTDLDRLKPLINSEAWDSCVAYGWLNSRHTDSFAFRAISNSFGTSDRDALFPLVNEFPLINVNMAAPDILAPIVMRGEFKIKNPKEKMGLLKDKLLSGPLGVDDIASALDIKTTSDIFCYLGTKTSFWKINLLFRPGITVEIIVAAVPKRRGGKQEIDRYELVDWSMEYEYK
jgi:hypothetical protein